MLVTPSGIVTLVKSLQPKNALFPMLVTPDGIVIADCVQAVPSHNTLSIITKPSAFICLLNQPVPENALVPMLVTLSGIVISSKLLQL
jgi:type II secretory pathway component PulC